MKKYILLVVSAVVLAFTSCSDKEEIEIKYLHDLSLSINTSSLYETYSLTSFQNVLGTFDGYYIGFTSLLYDSNGQLRAKKDFHTRDFQPINDKIENLEEGNYTLITIQCLVNSKNDYKSAAWSFDNIESLESVRVVTSSSEIYWFNCLGISTEYISLTNDKSINIVPQLAGCFVDFKYENFDKSKYNYLGFNFKNAAYGIYLNPELSVTEHYYYPAGFNSQYTWNPRAFFDSTDGLLSSGATARFILETGNINYCFGPSIKAEDGSINFTAYPSRDAYFNFEEGNRYTAFCYYKGEPTVLETFLGTNNDFNSWYQNLDKTMNPIFVHPNTSWGISVNDLKTYMSNNGYSIWYDITKADNGLYYLGYSPLYKENSIQYIFETETTNLLYAFVNICKEDASVEDILSQLNKSSEYAFDKYYEEYGCYIYYNKQTQIEIYPDWVFEDGTEYTQLFYGPSRFTETRSSSNNKVYMKRFDNIKNNI